mgnify:CR=1 FL=1|tara:strand:- start:6 stop:848 length:843 start_codon:yes stop_codon:yes gene_type:complete
MKIISSLSEFKEIRNNLSGTIGFIPTMGALHGGHLSLVKKSNQNCDHTIVSIFINPTQFSKDEDLNSYPKTLERDLGFLKKNHVDVVFLPTNDTLYPRGYSTFINENIISRGLEAKSRPTFFRGVTTIVAKLFNIVNPTHSFFGEKDAQQLRVINKMVADLNFPIEVVACPIVREENGLAMSSRNEYLSVESKKSAAIIYNALTYAIFLLNNGERNSDVIKREITKKIDRLPAAKIDYISLSESTSLTEIKGEIDGSILISMAVFFDGVRLIDNISYSSD